MSTDRSVRAVCSTGSTTFTIVKKQLRDAVFSRWFVLYTCAFTALGLGVSYVSASGGGATGFSGFGRTTAGMINIVLLVVPLMALTAGASSIAGERDRGMLAYILAQPVSRWEVLLGMYIGLALALLACITTGFGICTSVMALSGVAVQAGSMFLFIVLTYALALAMLSVGMLISTLARKSGAAIGLSVFVWLVLVFVSDLGIMAGVLALRIRVQSLLIISIINPMQAFKMWALRVFDATIDVLGPAGLYAMDTYPHTINYILAGSLAAWILLPLVLAILIFQRRSPV